MHLHLEPEPGNSTDYYSTVSRLYNKPSLAMYLLDANALYTVPFCHNCFIHINSVMDCMLLINVSEIIWTNLNWTA